MASKMRLLVDIGAGIKKGRPAVEELFRAHLAQADLIGSLPAELHNAPRWKKAQWIWKNLQDGRGVRKRRFLLTRERKNLRYGRSKFMRACSLWGIGVPMFHKEAPVVREAEVARVMREAFAPPRMRFNPEP